MLAARRHHSTISDGSAYVGVTAYGGAAVDSEQADPAPENRPHPDTLVRTLAVGFFLGKLWGPAP